MSLDKSYFNSIRLDTFRHRFYSVEAVDRLLVDIRAQADTMNRELEASARKLSAAQQTAETLTEENRDLLLKGQTLSQEIISLREDLKAAEAVVVDKEALRAEIIGQANAEAEELLTGARADAELCVATAQTEAEQCLKAAKTEAEERIASACAEAEQNITSAKTEAEQCVTSAKAEAEQKEANKVIGEAKKALKAALKEGDENAVSKALDEYMKAREGRKDVHAQYRKEYTKVLGVVKTAKLYIAEDGFRTRQLNRLGSGKGPQPGVKFPQGQRSHNPGAPRP